MIYAIFTKYYIVYNIHYIYMGSPVDLSIFNRENIS